MLQMQRNYVGYCCLSQTRRLQFCSLFFRPVFNQPCYFIGASSIVALNWVAVYASDSEQSRQDCEGKASSLDIAPLTNYNPEQQHFYNFGSGS